MSNVQPCTQPIRMRLSPASRAGSAIARSFSPAFDRHGLAYRTTSGGELVREVVAIDDVHPVGQSRDETGASAPTPTRRQRIVIARNEKDRNVRTRMIAERLR